MIGEVKIEVKTLYAVPSSSGAMAVSAAGSNRLTIDVKLAESYLQPCNGSRSPKTPPQQRLVPTSKRRATPKQVPSLQLGTCLLLFVLGVCKRLGRDRYPSVDRCTTLGLRFD